MIERTAIFLSFCLAIIGCSEPFAFESISFEPSIVVSARLTNEMKAQEVFLTSSYSIDGDSVKNLSGAMVFMDDEAGNRRTFLEDQDGVYRSSVFAGKVGDSYRLTIQMSDGIEVVSEWEKLETPIPIGNIYGRFSQTILNGEQTVENGIQFFVDTDGLNGEIGNFRYEWEEVYQIQVPRPSLYEILIDTTMEMGAIVGIDTSIVLRTENITVCYNGNSSNTFIAASTAEDGTNSINEFPVRFVSESGSQLRTKYALNVRQYRLSPAAYKYYRLLRENNESGGFLFDKQQGEVKGNLKIENGEANVLGFFEVSSVDSLRKFFTPGDFFETEFRAPNYDRVCSPITQPIAINASFFDLLLLNVDEYNLITSVYPVDLFDSEGVFISTQTMAFIYPRGCASCDWYADTEEPYFWE